MEVERCKNHWLTIHVLPAKGAMGEREESPRIRTRTSPKVSNLLVYPGVDQCLSTSLNANRERRNDAVGTNRPSSNDCLAIPREASLPAKLAYIPS